MSTVWTPQPRTLEQVIHGSHEARCRVVVLDADDAALEVVGGSITEDQTDDVRRKGELSLAAPQGSSVADVRAMLASQTEVRIDLGLVDDDGVEHWWSKGIYRVSAPKAGFGADGALDVAVTIHDRSYAIKLASIDRRWTARKDTSIVAAVLDVLSYVAPEVPVRIEDPGFTFAVDAVLAEPGDDVWQRCRDLVATMGLDLHVDVDGTVVAPPVTDPLAEPTFRVFEPGVDSALLSLDASVDVADVVNVVVCPWEIADEGGQAVPGAPPVVRDAPSGGMGLAQDTDGPTGTEAFGKRVRRYGGDTSVIRSQAHADAAAWSELVNVRDLQASVSLAVAPDPRMRVGVPVRVVHPDLAVDARYRVTQVTWALPGGDMSIQVGAAETTWGRIVGTAQPAVTRDVTEIVTQVEPVLTSRSIYEPHGSVASVTWTQQVAGVAVGDRITVRHEGAGKRTAIALLDPKPLADQYGGEFAYDIGGAIPDDSGSVSLSVGGADFDQGRVDLTVNDRPFTYGGVDIGAADVKAAREDHVHALPNFTLSIPGTLAPPGGAENWAAVYNAISADRTRINAIVGALETMYFALDYRKTSGPTNPD